MQTMIAHVAAMTRAAIVVVLTPEPPTPANDANIINQRSMSSISI